MRGKLILVVGPSGAGKDTLIDGARKTLASDPRFFFARRAITRPASAGGEDHESLSLETFEARRAGGEFFAHWRANGLHYGAPAAIEAALAQGRNVILNASRRVVAEIAKREPALDVIEVAAPPEALAARLAARGRESAEDIAERTARAAFEPPDGVSVATVLNDRSVEIGVARFVSAVLGAARLPLATRCLDLDVWREPFCLLHRSSLVVDAGNLHDAALVEIKGDGKSIRARLALVGDPALAAPEEAALSRLAFDRLGLPVGAPVEVLRCPSPKSRAALRKKVGGGALGRSELSLIVRDLIEGRYSPAETAGFLVAASTNLSEREIIELTRLRAEMMDPIDWGPRLVLDKHSIGGAPGGRITPVIASILAAHAAETGGAERLVFPKTSSRAITSAAGTADTMEAAARVDLTRAEMRRAVETAAACVIWNGKINHSPLDDVMNAINRPLGVSSRLLDVSSILSKKLVAGATHALVDIPVGPGAKISSVEEGRALGELFEKVGASVGLAVAAHVSPGDAPIGRGVGPALELRDIQQVLNCAPNAPTDLRDKALLYAARLLEWDPSLPPGAGRARAEALLASGAAAQAFETILNAQGAAEKRAEPGVYVHEITAQSNGALRRYDGFALAGLARAAGAPSDKGAGVDLLVRPGERVTAGQPIFRLHSGLDAALSRALEEEQPDLVAQIDPN